MLPKSGPVRSGPVRSGRVGDGAWTGYHHCQLSKQFDTLIADPYSGIVRNSVDTAIDIFAEADSAKSPAVGDPGSFEPGEHHDAAVAAALYKRSVGVEVWSERLDKFGDVHRLRELLPPDPAAARAWLASRKPTLWGNDTLPPPAPLSITVQFVSAQGELRDAIDVTPTPTGGTRELESTGGV